METNEILTVTNAEYVSGYTLRIRFSDGVEKLFDFSGELSPDFVTPKSRFYKFLIINYL